MNQEWNGFYVPALVTPMDLNEDGILDVAFFQGTKPSPAVSGVTYVDVSALVAGKTNSQLLKISTNGELTWMNNIKRKWEDKMYYYPIPTTDLVTNPNLGQNTGWQLRYVFVKSYFLTAKSAKFKQSTQRKSRTLFCDLYDTDFQGTCAFAVKILYEILKILNYENQKIFIWIGTGTGNLLRSF